MPIKVSLAHLPSLISSFLPFLQPGCPFFFSGPLGVGKSTWARSFIQKLRPDLTHCPSPSFPLMIPYSLQEGTLWHIDLYRLEKRDDLLSLNLDECMEHDRCLIEWPERLEGFFPRRYLLFSFSYDHDLVYRWVNFSHVP